MPEDGSLREHGASICSMIRSACQPDKIARLASHVAPFTGADGANAAQLHLHPLSGATNYVSFSAGLGADYGPQPWYSFALTT